MAYVVRMARSVGAETMIHYMLRDRERVLDLFELLTGARFSLNFLRFGGVNADMTEGFIERVLEICELIRIRLKEYNDLFTFNHSFLKRTSKVGPIAASTVRSIGMTGPNARASGVSFDVRKAWAYSGYERLDFEIPVGRPNAQAGGDAHDRFLIRLREISQSIEILKQECESVPAGPFFSGTIDRDFALPQGEAYSRVESSRGMLGCHIVSDGRKNPARVQFRPPSLANLMVVPGIVPGVGIEDLPVVLASLDLSLAEADR